MDKQSNKILFLAVIFFIGALFYAWSASATINTFTLTSPASGYNSSSNTPSFNFTATGNVTAYNCTLFLNFAANTNATATNATPTIVVASSQIDGSYAWYINCTGVNDAGRNVSATRTIVVDTAKPSIIVGDSTANGLYNNATIHVNVSAVDTGSGLLNIQVKVYNSTGSVVNTTTSTSSPYYVVITLPDGNYSVNATSTDNAGNTNTTTVATAIVLDTVNPFVVASLSDADMFYSNYTGNNVVHVSVNATDASGLAVVQADFTNFSAACGIVTMTYSGTTKLYSASCDVSSKTPASISPISGVVTVVAMDNANNINESGVLPIILENFGTPTIQGDPCSQFGPSTTNFSQMLNFNSVNMLFEIQRDQSLACMGVNGSGFATVMTLNLTSVDISTPQSAAKLANLGQVIQVTIAPPNSRNASRIYVNSTYFVEMNTTATIKFFGLPFDSAPSVTADAGAAGVNGSLTWVSNGYNALLGASTGNLTFTVNGFSGYNIADTTKPTITINTPLNNSVYNGVVPISVTLNGTGTEISNVVFTLDGNTIVGDITNCTPSTTEITNCAFSLSSTQTNHNLSMIAYDYGPAPLGNNATKLVYFRIDNTAPNVTLNFNGTVNSTLTLNFTIRDNLELSNINCTLNDGVNTHNYGQADNTALNYAATISTDGIHTWILNCSDGVNTAQLSNSYTISASPPTINITSPLNGSSPSDSVVTLSFNATDGNGLNNCWYTMTGTSNISATAATCTSGVLASTTLYLTNNGTYTVTVFANDTTGSFANKTTTFTVNDATDPTFVYYNANSQSDGYTFAYNIGTVTLNVATSEYANCAYQQDYDRNFTAMYSSHPFTITGGLIHMKNISVTYSSDAVTNYIFYVRCQDLSGRNTSGSVIINFSVAKYTSSSSGGSGGGSSSSGGGSFSESSNPTVSLGYDLVFTGNTNVTISSSDIAIDRFSLNTNANSTDVNFRVTKFDTTLYPYSGKVYQYIEVNHTNLDNAKINSVKISFNVLKSWLTTNGLTKDDIVLMRYSGTWTMLTTRFVSEDATTDYFEADSPGLSMFAISAKAVAPITPSNANPAANNTVTTTPVTTTPVTTPVNNEVNNTPSAAAPETTGGSNVWVIIIIVVVIILIILLFIFRKKKK